MAEALTKTGRYQIVGELGRGSMGVVYQGYDPIIGRTVAIKTMLTEGLSPQEFNEYKARFQREAQAAGILAHPNIITVYDFGEDNGILYLAMEFLEGKSLEMIVEEQNILPLETIIPIYEQVCNALNFAHQHKIVHRDVKPANIMRLHSGLVKMTDFGIAKMMSMGMTQAGQILGTPNYMSPEQVKGRQVDGRSDIFSLGVILYELVTGEKPFGGQNITTVIYKIINENPIPPRELDSTIHAGLNYVIGKALAKNPDERYQTCKELAEDLKNYKTLGGAVSPQGTMVLKVAPTIAVASEAAPTQAVEVPRPPAATPPAARSGWVPQVAPQATPTPAARSGSVPRVAPQAPAAPSARSGVVPRVAPQAPPPPAPAPQEASVSVAETPISSPINIQVIAPAHPQQGGEVPQIAWVLGALLLVATVVGGGYYYHLRHPVVPPAPPAPVVGQLQVNANVPGAKISIDGQTNPSWVTPFTIPSLSVGTHNVVISMDGYQDFQQSVTIAGGQTNSLEGNLPAVAAQAVVTPPKQEPVHEKTVVPKVGQLQVNANISGATISIDGRSDPSWVTPTTISDLSAGTHNVLISKAGYDNFHQSVTIEGGETNSVTADFSVPSGEINIETIPPGVEVLIDGKPYGPSPVRTTLKAGDHTYTLRRPGSEPYESKFTMQGGAIMTKRVNFGGAAK